MTKFFTRTLLAAGIVACAAAAQAGPMTGSGETSMTPTTTMGAGPQIHGTYDSYRAYGYPSYSTGAGETSLSTNTMGAGPDLSGTTTYYVYSQNHSWTRGGNGASASFNVPGRAGEASTMTNGVPNLETSNYSAPVSDIVVVPYTVTN